LRATKHAVVTTGSAEHPAFPAQWLYGVLRALPGAPGFLATIICAMREHHRKLDTSVGVSEPHGLTVRHSISRLRASAPDTATAIAPRLHVRDDRETPLFDEAGWRERTSFSEKQQ
jgi:hypothetical protein